MDWKGRVKQKIEQMRDRLGVWWEASASATLGGSYTVAWPPKADRPRLARYNRYRALYEGAHELVYVQSGEYDYQYDREYVTVNICGEITDLLVDRLFGEGLDVIIPGSESVEDENGALSDENPAEAWLEELAFNSDFERMLCELATGVSFRGDGALKIRYDADSQQISISPVPPSIVFVETRPDDAKQIERIIIAYVRHDEANDPYLFQEIHTRGRISYRLHRIHGHLGSEYGYTPDRDRVPLATIPDLEELAAGLDENEEIETGIDRLLVVPIALGGYDEGGVWGRSDYADVDSLQGELNNRCTHLAEILDKHSDPWMYGPPLFLNEDQQLDPKNRYFAVSHAEQAPGYITWDGQMAAASEEIARIKAEMLFTAGLSPESFGLGEGGGAESGRALKLRQHRTAAAVQGRERSYDRSLREAISIASHLANSSEIGPLAMTRPPRLEPHEIILGWHDGLPNDTTEEIEQVGMEVSFQILSRQTAIEQRHPEWDQERVEEELDRIAAERGSSVPAPGAFGSTPISLSLGGDDEMTDLEENPVEEGEPA